MELYQVNVHVGHITQRQASMGGFALEATPSPPSPMASNFEDDDDDDGDDDGASSSDEMSTWHSYPLSLMTKRGSSFGI